MITPVPVVVRQALDELAAAHSISRAQAAADLVAAALGRSDLARKLTAADCRIGSDVVVSVAQWPAPEPEDRAQVGTQLPVELLPDLDDIADVADVSRSRMVGNLLIHAITCLRMADICWPPDALDDTAPQGRLSLAM